MDELLIAVPTAHCGVCGAQIQRALEALVGVAQVVVDLRRRVVRVRVDLSATDLDGLVTALTAAGHPPTTVSDSGPSQPGANPIPNGRRHDCSVRTWQPPPTPVGATDAEPLQTQEDDQT